MFRYPEMPYQDAQNACLGGGGMNAPGHQILRFDNSANKIFSTKCPNCSTKSVHGPRLFSDARSEEHTSELQSLMRISYAVFCLKKKNTKTRQNSSTQSKSSTTYTIT